jgi:hypothetical protein
MGYDDYASDQIIAELEVERDTARAEREAAQRKIESQKRLIRARELESERLREARAVSLPDDAEMERVFRDKIAIALSHNRRDMSKDAIEYFGDVVFIESLKDAVRTLLAPRPEQSAAEPVDTKLVTSLLGWAENVRTLAKHAIAGDNPKEAAYALAEAMTRAANVLANPAPAASTEPPADRPLLGLATTRELLAEISARIEVHGPGLEYRTVDPCPALDPEPGEEWESKQ